MDEAIVIRMKELEEQNSDIQELLLALMNTNKIMSQLISDSDEPTFVAEAILRSNQSLLDKYNRR